jgi:multiple sugar transport system permease protein
MAVAAPAQAPPSRRRRRRSAQAADRRLALGLLAPAVMVMLLVAVYPIGYAIWLSLNEYSLITPGLSRFAGVRNYTTALSDGEFWSALWTTFAFTAISVGLELVVGLAMALIMNEAFRGRSVLRAIVLVPWAVLSVVTAMMWRSIFEPNLGIANQVLGWLGLPGGDRAWLGEKGWALAVIILADVWKCAPFMALLLLAGLQIIPGEIYEAARVDGANAWQRFRRITLPMLGPAILVALIFRTLDALRIFDLPYVLTRGANGTETLSLYAYQELTVNGIVGLGSALSVITFVAVMGVSLVYLRTLRGTLREMTGGAPA